MYYVSFSVLKRKTNIFLSVNYSDENRLRLSYANKLQEEKLWLDLSLR